MKNVLLFSAGVAVGFITGCIVVKKKYEELANEEIESVKKAYGEALDERDNEEKEEPTVASSNSASYEKPSLEEVKQNIDYTKFYKSEDTAETLEDSANEIYLIEEQEYDTMDDYTSIELSYYKNNILADDEGNKMTEDEIAISVGSLDVVENFNEHGEVFIRNDARKVDYVITKEDTDFFE